MSSSDFEQFRAQLLALKDTLEQTEKSSKAATQIVELDQACVGRLSRMDAMQAQQMAQESERRRLLQLTKIEGALRRMESGDYGDCFVCGEPIDLRRLAADPTITRCINCIS